MDATQLIAVILGTAALIGALNVIWTKGVVPTWRGIKKNRNRVKQVDQVPEINEKVGSLQDTLARLEPLIQSVHHELHPNSGTSMKDAVDRIEETLLDHITDPNAHH